MEQENVLLAKINITEHRVDFDIEAHFIAEDFSDDRLEKDIEAISSIKDRLLLYHNTDQLTRIITEAFQLLKLNLKWRLFFTYIYDGI
jgi:predicted ABC-type ATPase